MAFVLSGGGNLGALQIGMIRALAERGIRPDLILGCSVGAINGAGLAEDPAPAGVGRLERLWRGLDGKQLMPSGGPAPRGGAGPEGRGDQRQRRAAAGSRSA